MLIFLQGKRLLVELFFLAVVVVAGYEIVEEALLGLMNKKFNMNLLMIIATAGAFMIGHGEESNCNSLIFCCRIFRGVRW